MGMRCCLMPSGQTANALQDTQNEFKVCQLAAAELYLFLQGIYHCQ